MSPKSTDTARSSLIEIVVEGGMSSLKELPKQEETPLKHKYFDEFDTYSPFKWRGSRRLTEEELRKQKGTKGLT